MNFAVPVVTIGHSLRLWLAMSLIALVGLFAMAWPAQAAQVPVPALTARVTDLTQTLDAATQKALTQKLADLEQRKGAQIAVLMVPTTGGDSIGHFARRVYDQWRLGREKVDDGILFVVAKNDRKLRIEVGYGLEGAVPDLLAGRIIREQVTPRFKQGDFAGGVTAGVDSLIALVNGEALPAPEQSTKQAADRDGSPLGMLLPLAFMAFMMPVAMAGLAGGIFVGLVFQSFWAGLAGAFLALILSAVGRQLRLGRGTAAGASRRGAIVGGLTGFGLGTALGRGGLGGGGGFGGGGFGGGGGMSGGGGASGGW